MKRPSLVFGLVVFTMALLFLFFKSSTLIVLCPLAVVVLLFYFFTKSEKVKKQLIIPTVTISILISGVSLCINNYIHENALQYSNYVCDIVGTVVEKTPDYYIIKTKLIDSNEEKIKILFVTPDTDSYNIYENIFIDNAEITESRYDSDKSEKCFVSVYSSDTSEKIGEKDKDLYYYILNFKSICASQLSEYLYGDSFGVIYGMLFGGTDYISNETKSAFRSSGIAHLLAVSGLHTSLWCGLFINILKFLRIKEKYANICGIFVLFTLTIISGFTPSVVRASFMMAITLIATVFKKHSDSINSLGLAAAVILLVNPYSLYTPSFFLSFLATTGVVSSSYFNYKINAPLEKTKLHRLIKVLIKYIYTSLLISLFATIFTLPASVYYFGTVSIIAPVTNLLTIKIAFFSMIATIFSLAISFIPFEFLNVLTEFLFNLSDNILKILNSIINLIGSFKYAAISVNENFVYCGIVLSILLFISYFIALKKFNIKPILRKIAVFVIISPVIISLILSVIPFSKNTSFTILGNTDTPNIIIKSGTHYVVINVPENLNYTDYQYLPKTNNDTIDLLAVTYLNNRNSEKIEYINTNYNIRSSMITSYTNKNLYKFDTDAFRLSQVSDEFTYSLKNEINISIFNTYEKNCAIIKFDGKIIVLSFSEYNDLTDLKKELGRIDVLILPEKVPDGFNTVVQTLIICSTPDKNFDKNDKLGYLYSDNFFRTSTQDDITLTF